MENEASEEYLKPRMTEREQTQLFVGLPLLEIDYQTRLHVTYTQLL